MDSATVAVLCQLRAVPMTMPATSPMAYRFRQCRVPSATPADGAVRCFMRRIIYPREVYASGPAFETCVAAQPRGNRCWEMDDRIAEFARERLVGRPVPADLAALLKAQ